MLSDFFFCHHHALRKSNPTFTPDPKPISYAVPSPYLLFPSLPSLERNKRTTYFDPRLFGLNQEEHVQIPFSDPIQPSLFAPSHPERFTKNKTRLLTPPPDAPRVPPWVCGQSTKSRIRWLQFTRLSSAPTRNPFSDPPATAEFLPN